MSDARIRALERAYREAGDPVAGGVLLRAREQAGALPSRGVELLALLHDPAALTLRPAPEPPPRSWAELGEWIGELRAFGPEVNARVLLAWLRRIRTLLAPQQGVDELSGYAATLIQELQAWIAEWVGPVPPPSLRAHWRWLGPPLGIDGDALLLVEVLRWGNRAFDPYNGGIARAIDGGPRPLGAAWEHAVRQGPRARPNSGLHLVDELVQAIRAELSPWAMGDGAGQGT